MAQATSWVNHLAANPNTQYPNQGYPKEITDEFGADLVQVLGPKINRIPYDQLSQAEVERRLKLVDEKLFLKSMRGGKQQMMETFKQFLQHLANTKALWGVDIPLMNIMPMEGTQKHPIEKCWINYKSQRCLYARHTAQLIFKFDPFSVFNGVGRMTKDFRKLFINDAQHRTIACMIFGIRYMAVQYIISDDENVDIDQFCACNVDNLPSEAFDNYRNRKERCQAYIDSGRPPIREDKFMWDIAQWAQRWNINIDRPGSPASNGPRGISHMPDLYNSAQLGFDVMDAAAAVLVSVYPTDPMKSANLYGLCELLSKQDPDWCEIDLHTGTMNPQLADLARVIQIRFGDSTQKQNSGTYHSQCKEAVNNWYKDKFDTVSNPSGIASEVKVAHATYWVYKEFSNKYPLTMPKNRKGETFEVLPLFTKGYKKWLAL